MCKLIDLIKGLGIELRIVKGADKRIATTNIYPEKGTEEEEFLKLSSALESTLEGWYKGHGEMLTCSMEKGRISDLGDLQADIMNGRYFELYCYDCSEVAFIRLWLESGTYYKKTWISLDIDVVEDSLWFSEELD